MALTVFNKGEVKERWDKVGEFACGVIDLPAFPTKPAIFCLNTK